jgi:hypothetical protein
MARESWKDWYDRATRETQEMLHAGPRSRSLASRVYAGGKSGLVDKTTTARIKSDWARDRSAKKRVPKRTAPRRRHYEQD